MNRVRPSVQRMLSRDDSKRRKSGFTLIEMMVAVAIVTMLMVAMSSAMTIYMQTATDSFDEIERAQISRALFRNLSRDIRSVTFVLKEVSDEEDEDSLDTETLDSDSAMASYTDGLFGTATDLVLYVSRPDADTDYVPAESLEGGSSRSSDAMIIRYFLSESGGGGLSGMLAEEAMDANTPDNVAGLGLMTGDMVGLSNAINTGDIETQLDASQLIAPEVASIEFRYYNGVEELTEWDSNVENAMPAAVIVILSLRTIRDSSDSRTPENTPGMLGTTQHRMVIPIPVADPYLQESTL